MLSVMQFCALTLWGMINKAITNTKRPFKLFVKAVELMIFDLIIFHFKINNWIKNEPLELGF